MAGVRIDLNADLGELPDGADLDSALLQLVTSANVACGGHAGDDASMLRVCEEAAQRGVAVGAQVSYVDRAGFGRARLEVEPTVLRGQLAEQLQRLTTWAAAAGTSVHYVKPHGALYHAAAQQITMAESVIGAIDDVGLALPVLTLPDSRLADVARAHGLASYVEAFADRGYLPSGALVPRGESGDLVHDVDVVRERVAGLAVRGSVVAVDGTVVALRPDSVCVHGDTPGAIRLAAAVREALTQSGAVIAPFVVR